MRHGAHTRLAKQFLSLLFFSILSLAGAAQAGTLTLEEGNDSYLVHTVVDTLEDTSGKLGFVDVSTGIASAAFRKSAAGTFSFGFTDSAYWFRFDIDNRSSQTHSMVLVLRTAWLDTIHAYLPNQAGNYQELRLGDKQLFRERLHMHPQFLIDLQVPPGKQTYYLRMTSAQAFMSPVELWEAEAFHQNDRMLTGYFGMFYGVLLVMFLYNAFIWFSTRDRSYMYYCLYLAAFFIMNFSYNGLSFQYLWPESPQWLNWTYTSWVFLYQLMTIVFAMVFLETAIRLPRMHQVLKYFLLVMVAVWLISLFSGSTVFHNAAGVYFVFLYSPLTAIAGILAWRSGFRAARFFVVASMGNLVGAFVTALTVSGFVPYSFVSFHAVEFGILADVVLLSLALADRINFLRLQKDAVDKEIIEQKLQTTALLQQAKDDLERTVLERTAELCRARDEAERLSRVDGLTGAYNRRYFNEVAANEFARANRNQEALAVVLFDIDLFKQINDTYGHALGDEVIKAAASVTKTAVREIDFVARIGGEEFAILLPGANLEQAVTTAERLRLLVEAQHICPHEQDVPFTASFGAVQLSESDASFEALLQRADEMMYMSKKAGRNRVSS